MSRAVLLVNLGSPDAPTVPAVRRYLNEFLMDGRVIDVPWPFRRLIVGLILIRRPRASAHAYQTIWTPEGSPLIVTSRNVQRLLQARVSVPVELAMRYQNPSIESAVRNLARRQVTQLHVIPLFPHYAMSSYETAVERVKQVAARFAPQISLTIETPYGEAPDYVEALVASAEPQLRQGLDHLLFSFHGVPERHIKKSDPTGRHCLTVPDCCRVTSEAHKSCYRHQCFGTAKAFAERARLPAGKWSVAFQSRLGRDPWLRPYTDAELERLARAGVRRLRVICPAFVSDCLETIEEIGLRGRETFLHAGGRDFDRIPCLNEHPRWIATLEKMVLRASQCGPGHSPGLTSPAP